MTTQDQPLLTQWIAALRSGDFKQGRMRLRSGNEYCCLGVACVLAAEAGDEMAENALGEPSGFSPGTHLPDSVAAILVDEGVDVTAGNVRSDEFPGGWVSNANDTVGTNRFDFDRIADVLEAEFVR